MAWIEKKKRSDGGVSARVVWRLGGYVRQIVDLSPGQRKRYLGHLKVLGETRVRGSLLFTKPVTAITEANLKEWLIEWDRCISRAPRSDWPLASRSRRCDSGGRHASVTRHRGARRPHRGATMSEYKVAYFVGSLSSTSINRRLSKALIQLAPSDLEFTEVPIGGLSLYSPDHDANYPPEAQALKASLAASDAVLFVTPEYNRSIPGALKNAIDWASRPWGQNSFDHMPAAVIGASIGQIGTAVAQQSLRGVLSFCNARQMTAPEAYIHFRPEIFLDSGEVSDEETAGFLRNFMQEFRTHVVRVLTVIPRT